MITFNSTESYKFGNVQRISNNVTANNDAFYMFVGDFLTHSNSQLQGIVDNPSNTYLTPYDNMIMGKLIGVNDVAFGIVNNPWAANTVYTMYDDQEPTLSTNGTFYVITNEGSFYHYWKVLDNNMSAFSTIQPQFSFVSGSNTVSFQTSDGYRWKYMTSVASSTITKFNVENLFYPVVANTSVSSLAVPGSLDVIRILQGGKAYNNYLNGFLRSTDIYPSGNRNQFNISNTSINTTNGYYTGCLFYVTSGVAKGEFRTITNYVSNSSGSIIQIDRQLLFDPVNGDSFDINPQVVVVGDGQQTINCYARALINATNSNSVYRVEILQNGANYRWANASVLANNVLSISNTALLRPILPPRGGHGFNVFTELYCHSLLVSTSFSNTEANTIPDVNQFQQIGIVRNPLWANVTVTLSPQNGNFTLGEKVLQIIPLKINANVTVTVANNQLSCNTAEFTSQVVAGSVIYFSTPDNITAQMTTVASVTNTSTINLSSNSNFSCTAVNMYLVNVVSNCFISAIPSNNTLILSNTSPKLQQFSSIIIGNTSGARGSISTTNISGVAKAYNTFIALYKYIANTVNGTFVQGETILQGNTVGYLHSTSGSGTVTLLASGSPFTLNGGNIVGNTSGAIASINTIYPPEIVFQSGEIQYVENILPVTRQNNETETIQFVLNF